MECKQCSTSFEVTDEDRQFYDKVSPIFNGKKFPVPEPTMCPPCRDQRRMTYRNERKLYHRKCDLTGKQIVTMYHPDTPYQVYSKEAWWGDQWDPCDYGRDFDFNRPFFDQFAELMEKVPLPHLVIEDSDNAEYTNYTVSNKNSYLIAASDYVEDCSYSSYIFKCQDCMDCLFTSNCSHVYESINCKNCVNSQFLQNCHSCSDSMFCYNCHSCRDCIGCLNLRQKQYCIFNEQLTKEEYENKKSDLVLTRENLEFIKNKFADFKAKFPYKYAEIEDCVNCTGDYLVNCKNCEQCFDFVESEDCKFATLGYKTKDCMDGIGVTNSELCYEACASPEDYALRFCAVIWPKSSNLYYCLLSRSSKNCFGCISTLRNEYCILNKQYTKEEYEELVPKIIDHMKSTGEWGEFFPSAISPFAYNETAAYDYYPLDQSEILAKGWKWHETASIQSRKGPEYPVPDKIEDVEDNITKRVLKCEKTDQSYKITPQELRFYREHHLPIPKYCSDQRHLDRMALRNPRRLFDRKCDKCQSDIKTTYSPDRSEKVYCESCYLKEVY